MQISEFVSQTLIQIVKGVELANTEFKKISQSAEADPSKAFVKSGDAVVSALTPDIHEIHFDIAVTVESSKETQGSAGVGISVVKLNTQGQSSNSNSSISRVSFSIPLKL